MSDAIDPRVASVVKELRRLGPEELVAVRDELLRIQGALFFAGLFFELTPDWERHTCIDFEVGKEVVRCYTTIGESCHRIGFVSRVEVRRESGQRMAEIANRTYEAGRLLCDYDTWGGTPGGREPCGRIAVTTTPPRCADHRPPILCGWRWQGEYGGEGIPCQRPAVAPNGRCEHHLYVDELP